MLPNNTPVLYIETFGGLHAIFANRNGQVESLAALPHKGMSVWLAGKKCPEIKWDQKALLGA